MIQFSGENLGTNLGRPPVHWLSVALQIIPLHLRYSRGGALPSWGGNRSGNKRPRDHSKACNIICPIVSNHIFSSITGRGRRVTQANWLKSHIGLIFSLALRKSKKIEKSFTLKLMVVGAVGLLRTSTWTVTVLNSPISTSPKEVSGSKYKRQKLPHQIAQ
jgi:hypothetical protein